MSDEPNDSPAFRLRPRAEPKSYYSIRLEYSANPAAFTRERPRSGAVKKRAGSNKGSYSKNKQHCKMAAAQAALRHVEYDTIAPLTPKQPVKPINMITKEDLEREERHKLLKRGISQSITANTMISPFLQRIAVAELRPASSYEQNYITLKIEKVVWSVGGRGTGDSNGAQAGHKLAVCRCYEAANVVGADDDSLTDDDIETDDDSARSDARLNVQLYDEYANEALLKAGKIMNIAKFRTGQATPTRDNHDEPHRKTDGRTPPAVDNWIHFDVIVRYDGPNNTSAISNSSTVSVATGGSGGGNSRVTTPLIPFVSITDMIEQPTEPFVEMAPPSPEPTQIKSEQATLTTSNNSRLVATPVNLGASRTSSNTSFSSKSTIIDSPDGHVNNHCRDNHNS